MFKKLEKPTALPPLPPLELLSENSALGELLDQWAEQREEIHRANGELFEQALKRMKRCAFINGILGRPLNLHFSWCPHSDWDEYWQNQGWPPLPELKQALNAQTGYPIVAVGIRGKGIDGTSWEHVAVRAADGRILDVTGIQPPQETEKAWSSHGLFEVVFEEIEDHQVDTYLNRSSEDDFKEANPQRTAKRIVEALRG